MKLAEIYTNNCHNKTIDMYVKLHAVTNLPNVCLGVYLSDPVVTKQFHDKS